MDNKKVYVYDVILGDCNRVLINMARPATPDFFIHNKLIGAGYTKCMWLDASEYIFHRDTDINAIEDLYEVGDGYEVFEDKLRDIGYTIEDLTTESSILI